MKQKVFLKYRVIAEKKQISQPIKASLSNPVSPISFLFPHGPIDGNHKSFENSTFNLTAVELLSPFIPMIFAMVFRLEFIWS